MAQDRGEQAGQLQRCAAALQSRRRWAEAEAVAGRASALVEHEPDAPALGRTLQALAGTLDDLGAHGRAETLYRRAATILSALPPEGPDDAVRIRCARGLAGNLRMQSRYDEADVILTAALALSEQLLGPSDVDTVATLTALGLVCEDRRRPEEAEELYRQALARAEGGAGCDPDEVAGIAAALSGLLERRSPAPLLPTGP
ncbi:MAG TPA: tetratricopeptide repeat protein [Acidimicrobiales bacterium]|nr:tetratricopeptide repeat protein [Acidimicrobiales bacterium]